MATVFIFSGLPFSGKSTFAKQAEEVTSLKRISFDDLWASFVALDDKVTYEQVIAEIEKLIIKQIQKGFSVIYDSTNLRANHRQVILDIVKAHDTDAVIVYFNITEEEMRRRQIQSLIDKTHHTIDEDIIQNALQYKAIPEKCVLISTEDDKHMLMREMVKMFPKR